MYVFNMLYVLLQKWVQPSKALSPANLRQAVFTTTFVLEDASPVLKVVRDTDGDWHFMGPEETCEAETDVISMRQMLCADNTLFSIMHLKPGQVAWRKNKRSDWQIEQVWS